MRLAFFQPDIPQNVGAAMRLCACFGVGFDIIEPCAFPLTDKGLRRAAMDYGGQCELVRHASWDAFLAAENPAANAAGDSGGDKSGRTLLFTTRAARPLWGFDFRPGDRLLFGRESAGVPDHVHDAAEERLIIPIRPETRSLNLVTAAAIALGEASRQGVIATGV